MVKTIHQSVALLITLLGVAHIAFTLHDYDDFSLDALWFAGSGLAIVFAGFLNLVLAKDAGKDRLLLTLGLITNLVCAVLFGAALSLMRQPQVFLGVLLFVFATATTLMLWKKMGGSV
jgi:hypothetical protein